MIVLEQPEIRDMIICVSVMLGMYIIYSVWKYINNKKNESIKD